MGPLCTVCYQQWGGGGANQMHGVEPGHSAISSRDWGGRALWGGGGNAPRSSAANLQEAGQPTDLAAAHGCRGRARTTRQYQFPRIAAGVLGGKGCWLREAAARGRQQSGPRHQGAGRGQGAGGSTGPSAATALLTWACTEAAVQDDWSKCLHNSWGNWGQKRKIRNNQQEIRWV